MALFRDHAPKQIIRNDWCLPIIKLLSDTNSTRLVYFGLPGIQALDIKTWIEYINYIIAIDCGDYNKNYKFYDVEKAKAEIKKLEDVLLTYEREDKINGYSLYMGFIEEVVLRGIDKKGRPFSIEQNIHIFNLDFCNSITSPFKLADLEGNIRSYHKTEVISHLLSTIKALCYLGGDLKFVMFLTIHSSMHDEEIQEYFAATKSAEFLKFLEFIKEMDNFEQNIFKLRFYLIDILSKLFTASGFIPEFLPTICYTGAGGDSNENNKLLCLTILGTYEKTPSSIASFTQKTDELTTSAFITTSGNFIVKKEDKEIQENKLLPQELIARLDSYKKYWI